MLTVTEKKLRKLYPQHNSKVKTIKMYIQRKNLSRDVETAKTITPAEASGEVS